MPVLRVLNSALRRRVSALYCSRGGCFVALGRRGLANCVLLLSLNYFWRMTGLSRVCYTEKASPTRHRPEHQHNARSNRRKQCSPNLSRVYLSTLWLCRFPVVATSWLRQSKQAKPQRLCSHCQGWQEHTNHTCSYVTICRSILPLALGCRVGVWFGFVRAALLPAVGPWTVALGVALGAMPGRCCFLCVTRIIHVATKKS